MGLPEDFATCLNYTRSLEFFDTPDYSYLRQLFRDLSAREGFQYDSDFYWAKKAKLEQQLRQVGSVAGQKADSAAASRVRCAGGR